MEQAPPPDQSQSPNVSTLTSLQHKYGPSVDAALLNSLDRAGPSDFWGMMRYHLGFADAQFRPEKAGSGKRFRSSLCLLCCEACGSHWRDALSAAAAIELLHNFSLIHDDIEDADEMRRHRPTLWKNWGIPLAINTGDGMFALANAVIAESSADSALCLELTRAFHDLSLTLTRGQHQDMSFEERIDVSADEYLDMIAAKTAAMVGFSAWTGARLGGAPSSTAVLLREFGTHLGIAFQIVDDVLGVWGEPGVTGKVAAQDLQRRKKSFPVLLALTSADESDRRVLIQFLRRESHDVDIVLEVLARSGSEQRARLLAEEHRQAAVSRLESLNMASPLRDTLLGLSRELTGYRPESSAETVSKV